MPKNARVGKTFPQEKKIMFSSSKIKSLLFVVTSMVLGISQTQAQVTLYKSGNFTGDNLEISATWTSGGGGQPWNDVINSIKVPKGWKIIIYEHAAGNPAGKSLELTSDWTADASWKNKISNISVVSRRSALNAGEKLNTGERLYSSNGAYLLGMQDDGHLCVYQVENGKQGGFVWGSGVHGFPNAEKSQLDMQTDGNLVVNAGAPQWSSKTMGFFDQKWAGAGKPVKLVLENDGKLNLYNAGGTVVWTAQ